MTTRDEVKQWVKSNLMMRDGSRMNKFVNNQEYYLNHNGRDILSFIYKETSFLQPSAELVERVYCIMNDMYENAKCKTCGGLVSFLGTVKGYRTFCCSKCANNDPDVKNKIEQTNIEKYGTSNPSQNKLIREKAKKTNLAKYGAENVFASKEIKEKIADTNTERYGVKNVLCSGKKRDKIREKIKEKYGVEHPLQSPVIMQKAKDTNMSRYGVENSMQLEATKKKSRETCLSRYGFKNSFQNPEVREKYKKTMMDKYGVDNSLKVDSVRKKIAQTNLIKYGAENVFASKEIQERIKQVCMKKYNTNSVSQREVPPESLVLINDKNWLIQKHHTEEINLYGISKILNVSHSMVKVYFKKHDIEVKNYGFSLPEKEIREFINMDDILFNDRNLIAPKELDVYIPEHKLAIEFNGLFWHSYGLNEPEDRSYHLNKSLSCIEKNVQLLHIFENEWNNPVKQNIWKSIINAKLNRNVKIYARKCDIRQLRSGEVVEFLNNNHLQGYVASKINLGLFYENELMCLMTFSKPRFNPRYEYELVRFCNRVGCSVVGGASRLFSYFKEVYNPVSLISYADMRYSNGGLYSSLGMNYLRNSIPNYFYYKPGDESRIYSRIAFQKHKLIGMLENFDSSLTEKQNMMNHDYRCIWDCGNMVFDKIF